MRKIEYICNVVKWFDKVNGNTYHSVNVTRCIDGAVVYGEFQYGYGNQYEYTAFEAMAKAGWIPAKYSKQNALGSNDLQRWVRDNNYPIMWNESHGLKRECVANGRG